MSDFTRVLEKLDKIDARQDEMASVLVENTANLGEHMRRTALLEDALKDVRKDVTPLKKLAERAKGVAWAVSVILGGVLAAKTLGLF